MKRYSRGIIIFLLLVMVMGTVAGCGNNHKKEVMRSGKQIKLEFSWWGNDERHAYTLQGVDLFQSQNPDIDVDCRYGDWSGFEKRTKVWMESHNEPDVMQINYAWLSDYSADGNGYYDLYQLADIIDLNNFKEEDLQFGVRNGKLNAIPIAFNTATIYYNQDIYDKYHLELPETWDDFFDAAKVMRQDNVYPIGMAKKQLVLFLTAYYEQTTGKALFNQDGTLNAGEEEIAYILDFYKRLLDEKVLLPIDRFSKEKFTNGEIAGSMFWASDAGMYCEGLDARDVSVVIGDYPKLQGSVRSGWYIKPATMYAISDVTKNPKEAGMLLNFLLNSEEMAEYQKTEKGVPISASAVNYLKEKGYLNSRETEANDKMLKERNQMDVMLPVMENENVINTFKSEADDYIYDKVSLEEAAKKIYQNIKQLTEK